MMLSSLRDHGDVTAAESILNIETMTYHPCAKVCFSYMYYRVCRVDLLRIIINLHGFRQEACIHMFRDSLTAIYKIC